MSRLNKVCITGAISSCICRLNKQKVLRREENVQRPPPVFVEACKVLVLCQSEALFSQEYEPPAPAKATKKRKEVDESAKAFATLH